jgi:RNA polymerase sigma-70 factor (ECF subfamily)
MPHIDEAVSHATRDERTTRFENLYRETASSVYGYCLRRGARELADDVVDDVYLVAWRKLDDVPRDALPWLFATARRVLANHRRSRQRQAALVDQLMSDARPLSPPADLSPVMEALRTLRPAEQELLLLVAWDGLSTRQAAEALGCSAVAARVRLHRVRRRLAAALSTLERESARFATRHTRLSARPREEPR